jgi:hypothetical protein
MHTDRLEALETRLADLTRQHHRLRRITASVVTLLTVGLLTAFVTPPRESLHPGSVAAPLPVLHVRELVVSDPEGVARVRIGAPLPEPIMLGKRFRRRGNVSGVLLYDSEGNERGGYVTGDSGRGAALTLDEINRAAIHLGVSDRGEMHLTMSNGQGTWAGFGIHPTGPYLQIGKQGKLLLAVPDSTAAKP